jgi:hypothetical protein
MKYTFCDSEFLSVREKQLVLKAWVRFLKHGLRFADFTKRLYEHLHLYCSFIAHYDRAVFYATYFERGEDTASFLSQFDRRGECLSIEYGSNSWLQSEDADLKGAMVEEAAPYIPSLIEKALAKQREADLAEAQRLLAKHGLHWR